jgi:hypothetical protein
MEPRSFTLKLVFLQMQSESVELPEEHALESSTSGLQIGWQTAGTSLSSMPRAETETRLAESASARLSTDFIFADL